MRIKMKKNTKMEDGMRIVGRWKGAGGREVVRERERAEGVRETG